MNQEILEKISEIFHNNRVAFIKSTGLVASLKTASGEETLVAYSQLSGLVKWVVNKEVREFLDAIGQAGYTLMRTDVLAVEIENRKTRK